jgi:hypothetical protein
LSRFELAGNGGWLARARRGIRRRVGGLIFRIETAWRELGSLLVNTLREFGLQRPARLLGPLRGARLLFPSYLLPTQFEGLLLARSKGWGAATPVFQQIAARAKKGAPLQGSRAVALLGLPVPQPVAGLSVPSVPRSASLAPDVAQRVVVYTSCFGLSREPPPVFGMPAGLRFVCFTDQPISPSGWEILPTQAYEGAAAHHAICAHEVLDRVEPPADWSLYIDPERLIVGNIHTLLTRWLLKQDFAAWRHSYCADWHQLAERHLVMDYGPAAAVLNQAQLCERIQFPRGLGAWDTTVMWRNHTNPAVISLMNDWRKLHLESPGSCEISFYQVLHRQAGAPSTPTIMPAALGPAEDNLFFATQNRRQPARPHTSIARNRSSGKLRVTFLCPEKWQSRVTAILNRQLGDMIRDRFSDTYEVSFTSDVTAARHGLVILTTYALNEYDAETIYTIKSRNLAVIGSWEDGDPKPDKIALLDAHMVQSWRQMLDFNRLYPSVPAFHVTQNVNTRIRESVPQMDRLRTAYFGDLQNTVRPDSLSGNVELFDTWQSERSWLDVLPEFNCHWIVRRRVPGFTWKPFIKGFVAARCGAVVIVSRDDENAPYYLGDDYPFYTESLDIADLEMAWVRVAAGFGGESWRLAREIMRQVADRSSDELVSMEFKAMVDEVLR